jgi:phosphatidylserine/phosphatidylglycerophosphate/cardiolipin synthase-like enzyme
MRKRDAALALFAFAASILVFLIVIQPSGPGQSAAPTATPLVNTPAPSKVAGGWYEVYFTQPLFPDDRARHRGGPDEALVALVERATATLDVAIYDFDLANVADAMARAHERGVRVRMVTDKDTAENVRNAEIQAALERLKGAGIPVIADARSAIMHHKFTVVDGEWVQTGSWNYTYGDTYRLNNNLIIIRSPILARNYADEFERMFTGQEFGPQKKRGATVTGFRIGETRVENYFAPKDKVASQIEGLVRRAQSSVYFMAFSFTHDGIGDAMMERAGQGVRVTGIFEKTGSNTTFSEYGRMKEAGLDVYQDGNPYSMHHKVIILDERTVILGSFNFSANADTANDENLLVIHDREVAAHYKAEFDRVLATAQNPPQR